MRKNESRSVQRKHARISAPPFVVSGSASRSSSGMSIATVLTMGVIISIFLSSMMTGLLGAYRKINTLRYATTLRSLNETGVDYVISQLNQGVSLQSPYAVPSTIVGDPAAGVSVDIQDAGAAPANSVLFDAKRPTQHFFLLTSTATKGGISKSLQVMLRPLYSSSPTNLQMPWAAFGANRVELVGQSGINSYNTNNPMQYSDIGTLGAGNQVGTGSTQRGVAQGGSQYEFPTPIANQIVAEQATMQSYNAVPVSQAPWANIMGNIYSNGDDTPQDSGYWPRGPQAGNSNAWNNVYGTLNGTAPGVPNGLSQGGTVPVSQNGSWTGGMVDSYGSYPAPQVPPAPQAPPGTTNLGNLTLSGSGTLKIVPNAPAPSGPLGAITNGTVEIPPGNYVVNSITMTGNSSIVIDPAASNTSMYVQGTTNSNGGGNQAPIVSMGNNTSVNMSGINSASGFNQGGVHGYPGAPNNGSQLAVNQQNVINETSGSASQLQIYSSSSGTMYLMGNARATIYAPSATVNIGAQPSITRDANFYGAVVGAVTRIISGFYNGGGAFLHYDGHLRPAGYQIDPFAPPSAINLSSSFAGYRAVTWREI